MLPPDLYERIRRRVGHVNSAYLDDEELGRLCEESYYELHDLLISTLGDEAPWERLTITTTPGADSVTVSSASRVYRILRVDYKGSHDTWTPVRRFELAAGELDTTAVSWEHARCFRYCLRRGMRKTPTQGGGFDWTVYFTPPPSAAYSVRLHYVPLPAVTYASSDSSIYASFPNEYPEFVVADVAAKLMAQQELDPSAYERERERIRARIIATESPHNAAEPRLVADHRSLDADLEPAFWRRRR